MSKYARRYKVAWAAESTTQGTDAFSGSEATDFKAIIDSDSMPFDPQLQNIEANEMTAVHSTQSHTTYKDMINVSFDVPLKAPSTVGDQPHHYELLQSANFEETLEDPDATPGSGDEFYSYSLITGNSMSKVPSASMQAVFYDREYANQYLWIVNGCRGNLSWDFQMGENAICTYDGIGLYASIPDTGASVTTPPTSYSGQDTTLKGVGGTLDIDSVLYDIESLTWSTNWTVAEDRLLTASTGTLDSFDLIRTPDSAPSGAISFRGSETVVTDLFAKAESAQNVSMSFVLSDGSTNLRHVFQNAQLGHNSLTLGENSTHEMGFQARGLFDGTSEYGENEVKIEYARV